MRRLLLLFTASVAFQWTTAEPTSTPTTHDDPLDKSAFASHLKIDKSDTPRILGLRDVADSEDDHVHPFNEERAPNPLTVLTPADATPFVRVAQTLILARSETSSISAYEKYAEDLKNSFLHLESIKARGSTPTAVAAAQILGTIEDNTRTSVATLVRSVNVDPHGVTAMLRALAVRYKDVAGLVLNECREKLVHPDLVFLMLPFSEEIHVRGLQNYARFRKISDDLERYLDYVKYFFNRPMNRASQTPRGQPHMRGYYWYEHFVVQTMLEAARPQEVVAYLEYLRIENRLRDFVTRADRVLLAMHPEKTEDLLLRSWAVDDLDLKGAIGFMPWGDFHAPDARVAMDKEIVVDIRKRFRQVLKYVRLYREVQPLGRLDDMEVADALKYWSTSEELLAYRELLKGHLDEYGSFEKLVKVVGTFYPFTKKEIAKSKRIVADILRGTEPHEPVTA